MKIPNLKRIKISSELELSNWLAKSPDRPQSVMLVTNDNPSSPNHVSRAQVAEALVAYGWETGPRYTLNDKLIGHVIAKPPGNTTQ